MPSFKPVHFSVIAVALSACLPVPMASPDIAAAQSYVLPPGLRSQRQCQVSAAIMADPTSTFNERDGATTAARANGCPGF